MMGCITSSVKSILEKLNKNKGGTIFIVNNDELLGTVTDGDLRRALINGLSLDGTIEKAVNTNPLCCIEDEGINNLASCLLKVQFDEFPFFINVQR